MNTRNIVPGFAIFAAILALAWLFFQVHIEHSEPPPGYRIITNGHGKFAPQNISSGTIIERDFGSMNYGMSRQRAINRAWEQYAYEQSEAKRAAQWNRHEY
jgi:hypothetical protein